MARRSDDDDQTADRDQRQDAVTLCVTDPLDDGIKSLVKFAMAGPDRSWDELEHADAPMPKLSCRRWTSLPRCHVVDRRHGSRAPRKRTTSKSGCRDRTRFARFVLHELSRLSGAAREHPLSHGRQEDRFRPTHSTAPVFALGRTLVAILENFQQPDGSVSCPKRCASTCAVSIESADAGAGFSRHSAVPVAPPPSAAMGRRSSAAGGGGATHERRGHTFKSASGSNSTS